MICKDHEQLTRTVEDNKARLRRIEILLYVAIGTGIVSIMSPLSIFVQ